MRRHPAFDRYRDLIPEGYVYDMGDNWQHWIIVEKLKPAEPGAVYPQFLGGERRCPPEDCGGHPGYYDFLDNIASKQNK